MWKDSIKIYQCVDVSRDMNETAENLLRSNFDIFTQFDSHAKCPNKNPVKRDTLNNLAMYIVTYIVQ